MAKKPEETEEEREVLVRAMPVEGMFNEILDRQEVILAEILELKKIASEE